jgi:hypothetical protein
VDPLERDGKGREREPGSPLAREHFGRRLQSIERRADARAEPSLADPLGERVAGGDAAHVEMVPLPFGRFELGIVELRPAKGVHRTGENIPLPDLERGREVGLMEPHRAKDPALVPERGLEVAPPTRAAQRAHGGDGRLDRRLGAGGELRDRGHLAPVPVTHGDVEEEVFHGSDLEAGQAARHLRPDPLEIANRIGKGGHSAMLGALRG